MHRHALASSGLEGEYTVIRAGVADVRVVLARLIEGALDGLNVTMPLKEEAWRQADTLTSEAAAAGSVNSLRVGPEGVEAHSTDVTAFREIFDRHQGERLHVLGAGGSARAALAAWRGRSPSISVVSSSRLGAIVERWPELTVLGWGSAPDGAIVVNATPVGMGGEALPPSIVEGCGVLIDLPYGEAPTPASVMARRIGVEIVDGIDFLAVQAAHCFEWFTGVPVDSAALAAVARNV
jgi:shikimate dehydrogenase